MNELQRKKQMIAIHVGFKRKHSETGWDCYQWASEKIGRLISTLSACEDCELNYLRDILEGKQPKLNESLEAEFARLGIVNPDAWLWQFGAKHKEFGGCTSFRQLLPRSAHRLLQILRTRGRSPAPWMQKKSAPQPKPAPQEATLFKE